MAASEMGRDPGCWNGRGWWKRLVNPVTVSAGQGDNPPIDALWARPYVPPPNWAPIFRAPPFWTIFMALTDLVVPQAVVPSLRVNNKKQALQELATPPAAICGPTERQGLEGLGQRERLAATRLCTPL